MCTDRPLNNTHKYLHKYEYINFINVYSTHPPHINFWQFSKIVFVKFLAPSCILSYPRKENRFIATFVWIISLFSRRHGDFLLGKGIIHICIAVLIDRGHDLLGKHVSRN